MRYMTVKFLRVDDSDDLPLPKYETAYSAGMDLRANVRPASGIVIDPWQTVLIPTGLKLEIPHGYEGQIRPRSGLALSYSIVIPNAPGTIDADFRGEVKVMLRNQGTEPFRVVRGMRVAQIVFSEVTHASLIDATTTEEQGLSQTKRSGGGFGHTGTD